MKKVSQKFTSVILAVLITILSCPISAMADIWPGSGSFKYKTFQHEGETYAYLTKYVGSNNEVVVPEKIDGITVKGLSGTFRDNTSVTAITVPDGIEFIGDYAFYSLQANTNKDVTINLPNTIKYIGKYAFARTGLDNFSIPQGVEAINDNAFDSAGIHINNEKKITIPDSTVFIGKDVFNSAGIKAVTFGKNARFASNIYYQYLEGSTGDIIDLSKLSNPFKYCSFLYTISVDEDNQFLTAVDDHLYSKDMKYLISYGNYNQDYYYKLYGVDSFNPAYLLGLGLLDFSIPDSVIKICDYAFCWSSVNNLYFNSNLKTIGSNAFWGANVKNIIFNNNSSLELIDDRAFYSVKSISAVNIPSSVKRIGCYAFEDSSITDLNFEEDSNCTEIDGGAFYNCKKLERVFIPKSVISLGGVEEYDINYRHQNGEGYVFSGCSALKTVEFEDNSRCKYWGYHTFYNTNIQTLDTGQNSGVNVIEGFSSNCLEKLDLSRCSKLSEFTYFFGFNNCTALKTVDLSNTQVSTISKSCFADCPALKTVVLSDNTIIIDEYAFQNDISLCEINLDHVKIIKENSFSGCNLLENKIPEKTEKMYDDFIYAENDNEIAITGYVGNSKDVIIPSYINDKPVVQIAARTFFDKQMDTVKFPTELKYIGDSAFQFCENLNNIVFPDSLIELSDYAFSDCKSLTSEIVIPSGVKSIPTACFSMAPISRIVFNEGLQSIGQYAFASCTADSIILPNSLTSISSNSFNYSLVSTLYIGSGLSDYYIDSLIVDNDKLISYEVNEDNNWLYSEDGILYSKDKAILYDYPTCKNDDKFEISKSTNMLYKRAFDKTMVKSVFIPNSITSIGFCCFSESESLIDVEFEEGVCIDDLSFAFYDCYNLTNVMIPDNAAFKHLDHSFFNCSVKAINLPNSLVSLGESSFYKCRLQKVIIPKNIISIGIGTFDKCIDLSYVDVGSVKSINHSAFRDCTSLQSIDLTGVTFVDKNAFAGCSNLTKFYFSDDSKQACITEDEFEGNNTIETVVIGNSVTEIQGRAFANCTNLETALIGDEVEVISDTAFENCDNLTIVCLYASPAMSYAKKNNIKYQTFTITPIADQTYTGKAIKPALNVKQGGAKLTANVDYSATYSNNINVGRAKVYVAGLGDYKIFGATANFNIVAPAHTHSYTSKVTKPATCATNGIRTYTCSCGSKFTETIKATGKHSYTSKITKQPTCSHSGVRTYTCTKCKATKTETVAKKTHKYKTKTTSATTRKNGSVVTKCSVCGYVSKKTTIYYPKTIKLSKTSYTYNGKVQKPTVTVKDSKGKKIASSNYTVTYAKGRKTVSTYTVTIKFKGRYSGTVKKTFTIKPKAASISKLTAKSKGFTIKWKKQDAQTTGYQIQYSTSSKFKSAKTVTVSKNKTTSKTVSKLKAKKKYYVRVRTYKTVKGKKYYSTWSKPKSVVTKK